MPLLSGLRRFLAALLVLGVWLLLFRLDASLPVVLPAGGRGVTQGEDGTSLLLVLEGLREARLQSGAGAETVVGSLRAGDCFGEFSLLTGEPRSASVDAVTECRLLEVQRSDLEPVLAGRPELAHALSDILARRRLASRRTIERLGAEAAAHPHVLAERMLRRIRVVFGLVDQHAGAPAVRAEQGGSHGTAGAPAGAHTGP